jgi:ABC-type amino acid transport substrate-binding protein
MSGQPQTRIRSGVTIVLAVVASVVVTFLLGLQGRQSHGTEGRDTTLAQVQRTGVIRAAYIVWPPAVMKDPNTNQLSGHFVDTAEFIAKEMGARIDWEETNWDTFVAGLQANRFDLVVAGTYVTIPRAKAVSYTRRLFLLGTGVLVRAGDDRFRAPDDLNRDGVVIACTQGTGDEAWAREHLPKARITSLPGPDLGLALLEVENGKADAALQDAYTVRQFSSKHANVKALFVDEPINLTAVAWTLRHGDQDWKNFLDSAIEFLDTSGRLKAFERRNGVDWKHRTSGD